MNGKGRHWTGHLYMNWKGTLGDCSTTDFDRSYLSTKLKGRTYLDRETIMDGHSTTTTKRQNTGTSTEN